MPSPATYKISDFQQDSPSSGSTASSNTTTTSASDSASLEMADNTLLEEVTRAVESTADELGGTASDAAGGRKTPARNLEEDHVNGSENDGSAKAISGVRAGYSGNPDQQRSSAAEVSKFPCKRCAMRDLVCEVRPGCRACDRCGKMKTRCSLSELTVSTCAGMGFDFHLVTR